MSVTQTEFRAALLDASVPVPAGLLDGAGAPTGRAMPFTATMSPSR